MTSSDQDQLERMFDAAMLEIYERAGREVGYWATRYLQMLRRRGGLDTARYLLAAKVTSDGYRALRDAGRLDLTVESYVLRAEFQPLFTEAQLNQARDRLEYFGRIVDPGPGRGASPVPELLALLQRAKSADPSDRIKFRDPIAAYGPPAVTATLDAVAHGLSPGFAAAVIERVGRDADRGVALRGLRTLRSTNPDWASVIDGAISRLSPPKGTSRR